MVTLSKKSAHIAVVLTFSGTGIPNVNDCRNDAREARSFAFNARALFTLSRCGVFHSSRTAARVIIETALFNCLAPK